VDPGEAGFAALGKGVEEGKPAPSRVVSKGLVRGKSSLSAVSGVAAPPAEGGTSAGKITALRGPAGATQGATALKAEEVEKTEAEHRAHLAAERAAARAKGYEGEACPECYNFTMVRNGTCLKCDTCGATTGCS
jgi:ribonucleoside-diphosphate reductase alpha chain